MFFRVAVRQYRGVVNVVDRSIWLGEMENATDQAFETRTRFIWAASVKPFDHATQQSRRTGIKQQRVTNSKPGC